MALALRMAGSYLRQKPHLPLADFLVELRAQSLDHAALTTLDDDSPTEHTEHITQTIALSYNLLLDTSDERSIRPETGTANLAERESFAPTHDNASAAPHSASPESSSTKATRHDAIAEPHSATTEHADTQATRNDVEAEHTDTQATRQPAPQEPPGAPQEPPGAEAMRNDAPAEPLSANEHARRVLDLAAHAAPGAPIPLVLLRRAMEDDEGANAGFARLVATGLATYADDGEALLVRRLVAAFAHKRQVKPDEAADALALLLRDATYDAGTSHKNCTRQPRRAPARDRCVAARVVVALVTVATVVVQFNAFQGGNAWHGGRVLCSPLRHAAR